MPCLGRLRRYYGYDDVLASQQVAVPAKEEPGARVIGVASDLIGIADRLLDSRAVRRKQLRVPGGYVPLPLRGPFYLPG